MIRGISEPAGVLLLVLTLALPVRAEEPSPRLLYITHSAAFRHDVLPLSTTIVRQLGSSAGFSVTASDDVAQLAAENLGRYAALIFFTTGELPLSEAQKQALLEFVRSGHGFIGVHSATDTFYSWREYLELIGGYFNEHPWHQRVTIDVVDRKSPLVRFLGPSFDIADEIYQISDFDYRHAHVLLRLDPSAIDTTKPGVHRRFYGWPLAWTRSYGKGRVFYTALGHEEAVWRDPRYQQLLLNGINWAMRRGAHD